MEASTGLNVHPHCTDHEDRPESMVVRAMVPKFIKNARTTYPNANEAGTPKRAMFRADRSRNC